MVLSGVILVALAVLLLLTTMALTASGQQRHPARALVGLVALLVAGLALLFE